MKKVVKAAEISYDTRFNNDLLASLEEIQKGIEKSSQDIIECITGMQDDIMDAERDGRRGLIRDDEFDQLIRKADNISEQIDLLDREYKELKEFGPI